MFEMLTKMFEIFNKFLDEFGQNLNMLVIFSKFSVNNSKISFTFLEHYKLEFKSKSLKFGLKSKIL